MVFRNWFQSQTVSVENFSTFESQCVLIESATTPLVYWFTDPQSQIKILQRSFLNLFLILLHHMIVC